MTTEPLRGRGAVVTGGGRGIGAAVARALADAGASVVVAARTTEEIEAIAKSLRERGGKAWAVPCDVADEASVKRLGADARGRLGTVDILVNNAGASASAPLRKITLEEWNRLLSVNATSTFLVTREFAPEMAERGWGRVINVASIAGLEGARYVAAYSAAKHAVIGFTRAIAAELGKSGVTVNAICPGYTDTPMTERTLDNVQSQTGLSRDRALAAVLSSAGQERLVTAEEVAALILDFCGEDSKDRNGRTVVIGLERKGAGQ